QPSRYLHDCSDGFRLERIAGWALHPPESAALSRRTPKPASRGIATAPPVIRYDLSTPPIYRLFAPGTSDMGSPAASPSDRGRSIIVVCWRLIPSLLACVPRAILRARSEPDLDGRPALLGGGEGVDLH